MIDFEMPKPISQQRYMLQTVAEEMMRPHSRYFDEHEHEVPWDYINFMHQVMSASGAGSLAPKAEKKNGGEVEERATPNWLPIAGFHARNAILGRRRHVLGYAWRRAWRGRSGSNRHPRAKTEIPGAFPRRETDLWRHGDDRTAGRLGHLRHTHHRGA